MTNYIYLLYGTGDDRFLEASYCIGTLTRQLDAASSQIIVFTDQPEKIKDWPVICESVAGKLEAMRGKTSFQFRAKLCVILRCLEKYPGNVIYLDSDTFVRGDIAALAGLLSLGTAIMDSFESKNPLPELSGFHTTLAGNITYQYTPDSRMYNAGVIGIHREDCELVSRALELCDALLDFGCQGHTVEQFSISEVLRISNTKILVSRSVVTHYVSHKIYMRNKISEMIRKTGRPPWRFEREVFYSHLGVHLLRKLGFYLK